MDVSWASAVAALGVVVTAAACDGKASEVIPERAASRATAAGSERRGPFIQILGTVQDGGLPHAACSCDRCLAARRDPDRRRLIASLAVILPESGRSYLIDATPDLRSQLDQLAAARDAPPGQVNRRPVDGVFLTHAHIGHYLGLAFFGYEAVHTSRLPVIATPRMASFLRKNGPWSQLVRLNNIVLEELAAGDVRTLGEGISVAALDAPHRDEFADTVGFVVAGPHRRVLYLPDTDSWAAWDTPVTTTLAEVDIALLDGTFFSLDELPGRSVESIGHPLISDSMDLLQPLVDEGRLEVHFTHLNHSNPALEPDSEARRQIEARGFHVLSEGETFFL